MLKIHFLNVGHGDCTIIEHPSNRITVIDINNGADLDRETAEELAALFGVEMASPLAEHMFATNRMALLAKAGYDIQLTNPIEYLKGIANGRPIFRYIQTH